MSHFWYSWPFDTAVWSSEENTYNKVDKTAPYAIWTLKEVEISILFAFTPFLSKRGILLFSGIMSTYIRFAILPQIFTLI